MVLDGTVGSAGHARAILAHIGPKGFLIGLDQDQQAIDRAQKQLEQVGGNFILKCSHFVHLGNVLDSLNLSRIHAVLLDIGVWFSDRRPARYEDGSGNADGHSGGDLRDKIDR